jgi:hypothetical protein
MCRQQATGNRQQATDNVQIQKSTPVWYSNKTGSFEVAEASKSARIGET